MMKRRKPSSVPMPVALRSVPQAGPPPVYTQAQQMARRRVHKRVHYTGTFELTAEIAAIVRPLAKQLATELRPVAYRRYVEDVADAAHAVVSAVVGLIAERNGVPKVRHLNDRPDDRTKALRTIADLEPRPPAPVIVDGDLSTGAWAAALVELARPYSAPLADVLTGALPPDHVALKGAPSTSERLVAELRMLDRAAVALEQRLSQAATYRNASRPSPKVDRKTQDARATLADLGVTL
jgi:hypothetical protein